MQELAEAALVVNLLSAPRRELRSRPACAPLQASPCYSASGYLLTKLEQLPMTTRGHERGELWFLKSR